jgi:hypothetical protein
MTSDKKAPPGNPRRPRRFHPVSGCPLTAPVEYSLTGYGRSVLPLVEGVRLWGGAHLERLQGPTDIPEGDGGTFGSRPFVAARQHD